MSAVYNHKFWNLVKELVLKHRSDLKPCKFYEANKSLVEREYKLLSSKPIPPMEYGVSSRLQK